MRTLIAGTAVAAALALGAYAAPGAAQAAENGCGPVSIAEMSWNSAAMLAHMQAIILREGYGCEVSLVPGDTVPTIASMTEKGEPDLAPEIWPNAHQEVIAKAVDEGLVAVATETLEDGGQEGWFVPSYMVEEHPELATIDGIRAHPELFPDDEEPGKGRFYNCPSGWQCQIVNENLMKAYGLADSFTAFDPGSGPGLAGAIAKAYERGEAVLAYYFGPTAILGKYDMVMVGGMQHDPDTWECIKSPDCADPQPNMYPPSKVLTLASTSFADRAPDAYAFVSSVSMPNGAMNALLAWQEDNQATAEGAALHFLETQADLWTQWVPEDVVEKVRAAL